MAIGAYLLINTGTGKEQTVLDALNRIEGVKQSHIVTGLHDVICYVECSDVTKIKDKIINEIRAVDGIQRTVTCFALDVSR
jgi:DNA-binding Lrp family transcriptional regulator